MNLMLNSLNNREWKQRILKIYWTFFIIYLIAEGASFIAEWNSYPNFIITYLHREVVFPLAAILTSILTLELLCRFTNRNLDYIFMITATIFAGILVMTNPEIPVMQAVMIVPLILSILFFEKKKVFFSAVTNLLFIIAFYFFNYHHSFSIHVQLSVIIISFTILASCAAGMIVVNRGRELLGNLRDSITSEVKLRAEKEWIETMSKMDALTGLANHKSFHDNLDQMLMARSQDKAAVHLALVDVDNFKSVNDTYGHWVGDIVLKRISDTLKATLQTNAFVSRYGGEEFGILFHGLSDSSVLAMLEEARGQIERIRYPEVEDRTVTVSMGLHKFNVTETKEMGFKQADSALYEAKRTGKNRICAIVPSLMDTGI